MPVTAPRLADRAAGVGAERERRLEARRPRPRTHRRTRRGSGRGPRGCGWGRTPSARWRSPSRTRPCWSCRGSAAPAVLQRARPRWRRRAGPSPRGSSSRTSSARPSVRATSLTAIGTPASAASSEPAAPAGRRTPRPGRARPRRRRGGRRAPRRRRLRDAVQVPRWVTSTEVVSPAARASASLGRGPAGPVGVLGRSRLLAQDPRDAEALRPRTLGAPDSACSGGQARRDDVLAEDVGQRQRCEVGGTSSAGDAR